MDPIRATVLFAVTAIGVLGVKAETETYSGWKDALCDEFVQRYFAEDGSLVETAPIHQAAPTEPTETWNDPDLVSLPEMVVRARSFTEEKQIQDLDRLFAARHRVESKKSIIKTQAFVKDFGKVRFGVLSIYYVPVVIGFSW